MDNNPTNANRRKLLMGAATLAAAAPLVAGLAACQGSGEQETKAGTGGTAGTAKPGASATLTGRRKLGTLEVSSVGLGVQNMSRTYQTTIPSRPEMINIIRTAFDRGVTFFDAAEAYGPHEVRADSRRRRGAVPRTRS